MRARRLTPPALRRLLAARLADRAAVLSSEANAREWVLLVHFHHVADMCAKGALSADQEDILCHRAVNRLLECVVVGGHPGLGRGADAAEERDGEHVVHAYGNVLVDCAAASECVDWTRCTSNDVWEVYHALGIEACVHVFFEQIKAVVSFDGTYVDDRHLLLICDNVCRNGTIMPLNRHGINRTDASPLMRCSFEETSDVLCDAAAFAEVDATARGVTAAIMTGQVADVGTGAVQVLLPRRRDVHDGHGGNGEAGSDGTHASGGNGTGRRVRAMRSTCRSFATRDEAEMLEYVVDDVRPIAVRCLTPPHDPPVQRMRARFRPVSPPAE